MRSPKCLIFTTGVKRSHMASARESDAKTVQAMIAARNQGEPAATPTDVVFEKFVLYKSDRADDVGSRTLLQAIEPVVEDFRVIDVSQLQAETLPEWLDGRLSLWTCATSSDWHTGVAPHWNLSRMLTRR